MLTDLFSNAVLGNSLVAIFAGLVAQVVATQYGFMEVTHCTKRILYVVASRYSLKSYFSDIWVIVPACGWIMVEFFLACLWTEKKSRSINWQK